MADETNDTQRKINEEDRDIRMRQQRHDGSAAQDRPGYQEGSSGATGGAVGEGTPAHQSGIARGQAIGGGGEAPGGSRGATRDDEIRSDFADVSGGHVGGFVPAEGVRMTDSPSGVPGQGAGSVGAIGGESAANEYGPQGVGFAEGESAAGDRARQKAGSEEPLGPSHQHSADGGSVVAAGGSSTGSGAGQAGRERGGGFVGSQAEESDEQDDPQQAGFAEQGRGAPEEGRDVERGGERTANLDTDVEGSSTNR